MSRVSTNKPYFEIDPTPTGSVSLLATEELFLNTELAPILLKNVFTDPVFVVEYVAIDAVPELVT